jgi:hypothetical protein
VTQLLQNQKQAILPGDRLTLGMMQFTVIENNGSLALQSELGGHPIAITNDMTFGRGAVLSHFEITDFDLNNPRGMNPVVHEKIANLSRNHTSFTIEDGQFYVQDVGSTNGTDLDTSERKLTPETIGITLRQNIELHGAWNPTGDNDKIAILTNNGRTGPHWTAQLVDALKELAGANEYIQQEGDDRFFIRAASQNVGSFLQNAYNNMITGRARQQSAQAPAPTSPQPDSTIAQRTPDAEQITKGEQLRIGQVDGLTPDGLTSGSHQIGGTTIHHAHDPNIRTGRYSHDHDAAYVAPLDPSVDIQNYLRETITATVEATSRIQGVSGGSTISMLVYDPDEHQVHFTKLGDSPMYVTLTDGKRTEVVRLGVDDSFIRGYYEVTVPKLQQQLADGEISQTEYDQEYDKAYNSCQHRSNVIRKNMGAGSTNMPTHGYQTVDLDALAKEHGFDPNTVKFTAINACDGPFEKLSDADFYPEAHAAEITQIVHGQADPATALLEAANNHNPDGRRDNMTALSFELSRSAEGPITSCVCDGNGAMGYAVSNAAIDVVRDITQAKNHGQEESIEASPMDQMEEGLNQFLASFTESSTVNDHIVLVLLERDSPVYALDKPHTIPPETFGHLPEEIQQLIRDLDTPPQGTTPESQHVKCMALLEKYADVRISNVIAEKAEIEPLQNQLTNMLHAFDAPVEIPEGQNAFQGAGVKISDFANPPGLTIEKTDEGYRIVPENIHADKIPDTLLNLLQSGETYPSPEALQEAVNQCRSELKDQLRKKAETLQEVSEKLGNAWNQLEKASQSLQTTMETAISEKRPISPEEMQAYNEAITERRNAFEEVAESLSGFEKLANLEMDPKSPSLVKAVEAEQSRIQEQLQGLGG